MGTGIHLLSTTIRYVTIVRMHQITAELKSGIKCISSKIEPLLDERSMCMCGYEKFLYRSRSGGSEVRAQAQNTHQ